MIYPRCIIGIHRWFPLRVQYYSLGYPEEPVERCCVLCWKHQVRLGSGWGDAPVGLPKAKVL